MPEKSTAPWPLSTYSRYNRAAWWPSGVVAFTESAASSASARSFSIIEAVQPGLQSRFDGAASTRPGPGQYHVLAPPCPGASDEPPNKDRKRAASGKRVSG